MPPQDLQPELALARPHEARRRGRVRGALPAAQRRGVPPGAALLRARPRVAADVTQDTFVHFIDAAGPVRSRARHARRVALRRRAQPRAQGAAAGARTRPIPPTSPTTPRRTRRRSTATRRSSASCATKPPSRCAARVAALAPHYRDVLDPLRALRAFLRRGRAGLRHRHRHRALAPVARARAARPAPARRSRRGGAKEAVS